jgi:hypothetical protein
MKIPKQKDRQEKQSLKVDAAGIFSSLQLQTCFLATEAIKQPRKSRYGLCTAYNGGHAIY